MQKTDDLGHFRSLSPVFRAKQATETFATGTGYEYTVVRCGDFVTEIKRHGLSLELSARHDRQVDELTRKFEQDRERDNPRYRIFRDRERSRAAAIRLVQGFCGGRSDRAPASRNLHR